jgi:DNA-directed RNA polymerase specialized sigma subunit
MHTSAPSAKAKSDLAATSKKISVRTSAKRTSVRISILRGKTQHESPNNLSRYKWRHPLPDAATDAELVRLAKSGDRKAADQLVKNYHRLIRSYAGARRIGHRFDRGRKEFTNGAFDDLIGRGFLALWQAVLSYDPSMGVPFSAYARRCISGQMSEEAKDFIKRGLTGETRIDRWLFSHPRATPAELVAAFKRKGKHISLQEAAEEIQAHKARYRFKEYRDEYLEEPRPKSKRRPPAE